jgi:hypothetical protein
MSQQTKTTYAVDIVFCIDCTGSMQPYLESVKRSATEFHRLLEEKMAVKNKGIRQLRVRIIAFRDIGEEADESIVATNFFSLPDEVASFNTFVSKLSAGGGGDEPESALEALALAIQSPWERTMDKRRHIVVVCTDASAHPLGKFRLPARLSNLDLPANMDDLNAMWGDEVDEGLMEFAAKRLLVFGPDKYPWSDLSELFENCIWVKSEAGQGMTDADQDLVLDQIAGSV